MWRTDNRSWRLIGRKCRDLAGVAWRFQIEMHHRVEAVEMREATGRQIR